MRHKILSVLLLIFVLMFWRIESTDINQKKKALVQTEKINENLKFSKRPQHIWNRIAAYLLGDTFHFLYPGLTEVVDDHRTNKIIIVLTTTHGDKTGIISFVDMDIDHALLHIVNNNADFFLYECSELLYSPHEYTAHLHKIRFYHLFFHELTKHKARFVTLFQQFRQLIRTFARTHLLSLLCAMRENQQAPVWPWYNRDILYPHQYLFFHIDVHIRSQNYAATNTIIALHKSSSIESTEGSCLLQGKKKKSEHAINYWNLFILTPWHSSSIAKILSSQDLCSNRGLYYRGVSEGDLAFNKSRGYIKLNAFLQPTTCWSCYWTKFVESMPRLIIKSGVGMLLLFFWESVLKLFLTFGMLTFFLTIFHCLLQSKK